MDLSNYNLKANAERGFDVAIKNPIDDTDTDIVISVVGSDSSRYRNANIASIVDFPIADDATTQEKADAITKRSAFVAAACITGWSGMERNGRVIEFSSDEAAGILGEYDWITDQISVAVRNRENFT